MRPRLSILVPVFNEGAGVAAFQARLAPVLSNLEAEGVAAEILFIDDGSRDETPLALRALRAEDRRIKILRLSRNFGSWNALLAGLHAASGDATVWLGADLQDPPELIPRLVDEWRRGAKVVWAERTARDDPWPRRLAGALFYRLLRRIAFPEYPLMGMDVCLLDRTVASLLGGLRERNRFTQGLILRLGFAQARVPYARERRQGGQSKWGVLSRLLRMGADMITGFTAAPLRLALAAGVVLMALGAAGGGIAAGRLLFDTRVDGWAVVLIVSVFLSGVNLATLGVLGEYVWRTLDEVRERPPYVIEERIGFEPARVGSREEMPRAAGARPAVEARRPGGTHASGTSALRS